MAALTAFDAGTFFVDDWESLKEIPYKPPDDEFDFDVDVAMPSMVRAKAISPVVVSTTRMSTAT